MEPIKNQLCLFLKSVAKTKKCCIVAASLESDGQSDVWPKSIRVGTCQSLVFANGLRLLLEVINLCHERNCIREGQKKRLKINFGSFSACLFRD